MESLQFLEQNRITNCNLDIIYVNTEFEINIASSEDIYQLGEEISDSSMVAFSSMKALTERNTHLKMKIPELTATVSDKIIQINIQYFIDVYALLIFFSLVHRNTSSSIWYFLWTKTSCYGCWIYRSSWYCKKETS